MWNSVAVPLLAAGVVAFGLSAVCFGIVYFLVIPTVIRWVWPTRLNTGTVRHLGQKRHLYVWHHLETMRAFPPAQFAVWATFLLGLAFMPTVWLVGPWLALLVAMQCAVVALVRRH